MKKVLVIADCKGWAFDKIYRGIKKNVTDWQVDVHYTDKSHLIPHQPYHVVLYLPDHIPSLIFSNRIPKHKLIWAIRWGVTINEPIYNNKDALTGAASILAASNNVVADRFRNYHPNIWVAPGGVDTDTFYFAKQVPLHNPIRVGWAGSTGKGKDYRGVRIIEEACKQLGYIWNPAIKEKRKRNEQEMVKYYHDEIDIYVELSKDAGRQNGLVEAGSCGLPCITSDVGIASQLIRQGENGFICDRTVESLKPCLEKYRDPALANHCGKWLRRDIEKQWSWKKQAVIFRDMFESLIHTK